MQPGDPFQGHAQKEQGFAAESGKSKVKNQDVIVANFNGEFICKIIDTQRRLLLSANKKNQDVAITSDDLFTIEGVVIRSIRCHRSTHLFANK